MVTCCGFYLEQVAGGYCSILFNDILVHLAEDDKKLTALADSDCIEVLPTSAAPKLEGAVNSHPASNGHTLQQGSWKQEQGQGQQNMGPQSKIWSGAIQPKAEDSSAAETPGFGAANTLDAISAQPATLMKQLSKGKKTHAGALKEEVQALLAMGFTEVQATKALQNCSHDVQRAANWLLAGT